VSAPRPSGAGARWGVFSLAPLLLSPRTRADLLRQMARFGVVGVTQGGIDTAVVYATRAAIGLYAAGVLAFFVAATPGWALNRAWTFRGRGGGPAHRQLAAFLTANALGFLLNRGIYATLVTVSPFCARNPVVAIAAGSVAGLLNFALSRQVVFPRTTEGSGEAGRRRAAAPP